MKNHKTTIKDVAAYVGVSQATVSRVLSGNKGISEQTSKLVLEACKKLNYVPNAAARTLTGQQSKMIGMIVPDISNPYFSGIFASVERTALQYGYHVLIANSMRSADLEIKCIETFVSRRIDGIIISPVSAASQLADQGVISGLPCIYMGSNHTKEVSSVEPNNELMAYEATKYLLESGHHRIAFLGGRQSSLSRHSRVTGYLKALREYGIAESYDYPSPDGSGDMTLWSTQATEKVWNEVKPDAILCFNDMIALKALAIASEIGLKIPEDLSIMGIDNISFSFLPRINLTTVSQSKSLQGRIAVERLIEKINGQTGKTTDIIEPKLIIRGTCRDRNTK